MPSTQPPGKASWASLNLASKGPRRRIEARICLMSWFSRAAGFRFEGSICTVLSSNFVVAPRDSIICRKLCTSEMSGTLLRVVFSFVKRVAARIGRVAFFEPLTVTSPLSLRPPCMRNLDIVRES